MFNFQNKTGNITKSEFEKLFANINFMEKNSKNSIKFNSNSKEFYYERNEEEENISPIKNFSQINRIKKIDWKAIECLDLNKISELKYFFMMCDPQKTLQINIEQIKKSNFINIL